MRQAIVIVLLFGAAFLGGAFVNGSGLQRVTSRTLRLLGLSNGGEITALDLESNLNSKIGLETTQALNQRIAVVTSPIVPAPSKIEDLIHKQNVSAKARGSGSAPLSSKKVSNSGPPNQPSLPSATLSRSVMKSSSVAAATPNEPAIQIRSDSQAESLPSQTAPPTSAPSSPAILDSLVALLPRSSPRTNLAMSPLQRSSSESKPTQILGNEWLRIESRMRILGIRSFAIESKPSGPVVCACFIPVVDHQAVTERFEADGDNIVQAAQAMTRRVILWRATQLSLNAQTVSTEASGN